MSRRAILYSKTGLKYLALVLLLVLFYFIFDIGYLIYEEKSWKPQDTTKIEIKSYRWSKTGVVLSIYSSSEIDLVLRQKGPALVFPFFPAHYPVDFYYIKDNAHDIYTVVIEWKYEPSAEFVVAVRSREGYWYSFSPYMPPQPDMSEKDFDSLKKGGNYKPRVFKFM